MNHMGHHEDHTSLKLEVLHNQKQITVPNKRKSHTWRRLTATTGKRIADVTLREKNDLIKMMSFNIVLNKTGKSVKMTKLEKPSFLKICLREGFYEFQPTCTDCSVIECQKGLLLPMAVNTNTGSFSTFDILIRSLASIIASQNNTFYR